jgi:RNA-directed DNA polymerase
LARRSKIQFELAFGAETTGEARTVRAGGTEADGVGAAVESPAAMAGPCMEAIVDRDNLKEALARVKRNKGAPGIDGMTVEALGAHLKDHWPTIRAQLLDGSYEPQPVRRVEIPKPTGGIRALGVPTVLDRFIQQAVLQALQAHWDGTFSASSYGFRPGCSTCWTRNWSDAATASRVMLTTATSTFARGARASG